MFSFNISLLCSFYISVQLPHYKYFAALQHILRQRRENICRNYGKRKK
jgi:hypothetical protein